MRRFGSATLRSQGAPGRPKVAAEVFTTSFTWISELQLWSADAGKIVVDDFVAGPVSALYEYVGKQTGDDLLRGELVENDHGVHGFQRGENFGALAFRQQRPALALELAHARVAIQAHKQGVAETAAWVRGITMR